MDQRILELFAALTFLLIAVYFITSDILTMFPVSQVVRQEIYNLLARMIFLVAFLTGVFFLIDVRKKE